MEMQTTDATIKKYMSTIKIARPTAKMIWYIELLFNDLSYSRAMRNVWLSTEFNRKITYLDDLTRDEGHKVIDRLKEIKESCK